MLNDLLNAPNTVHFPQQHQIEEYFPECRRLIVRHYKILYVIDESNKILHVVRVFDTQQNPVEMRK